MKGRTKALSIPQEVKRAVAERDSCEGHPCCILCGKPAPTDAPLAFSNAHYISRAQGGLGIEENILTLCPKCHRLFDGVGREEVRPIMVRHLKEFYSYWSESELTYKK